MTAPRRQNGVLVKTIIGSCRRKQRYSDEFSARAAGQLFSEKNNVTLYVYPCDICLGWHLTKHPQQGETRNVAYDFA